MALDVQLTVVVAAAAALRGKLRGNIVTVFKYRSQKLPGDAEKVRCLQPTPQLPGGTYCTAFPAGQEQWVRLHLCISKKPVIPVPHPLCGRGKDCSREQWEGEWGVLCCLK